MKARNAVMDGVSLNHRISFFEGNAQTIWWYSTQQCTIDITLVIEYDSRGQVRTDTGVVKSLQGEDKI